MSGDPESISSGLTLPLWMRSRIEKNDVEGTTYSPPSHDESFFYIRYPVTAATTTKDIKNINSLLQSSTVEDSQQKDHRSHYVDYSKHTEPCKKFLNSKDSVNSPMDGVKNPPKPLGTDDGFKGPGAACGSSIVKVAQQMVSGRSITSRGFQVASLDQNDSEINNSFYTKTVEDQQTQSIKPLQVHLPDDLGPISPNRMMIRRGSKSLPGSPLGSPKSIRKFQPNPYFTGTFFPSSTNTEGRGWFLSSLLGLQKEAISSVSVSHIQEESEDALAESNITLSKSGRVVTDSTQELNEKVLKAKPSELREMNFWSPTSM